MQCLACGADNAEGLEECANQESKSIRATPEQYRSQANNIALGWLSCSWLLDRRHRFPQPIR